MLKRRIVFSLWCIFILVNLFLHFNTASVILLFFTLILTAFSILSAYMGRKNITVNMSTDESVKACENAEVKIEVISNSYLPVFNGVMPVKCRNNEDEQLINAGFYTGLKGVNVIELEFKTEIPGEYELTLCELICTDIFGIVKFSKAVENNDAIKIMVESKEEEADGEGFVSDSKETKTE